MLRQLATDLVTGVRLASGIEASRKPVDPPEWGNQLDGFRMCEASELPDGFAIGWSYTAPVVDLPTYLGYLERRFFAAGGSIEIHRIASLDEAAGIAPVVVNCTGMAARGLASDPELNPIRGQLVATTAPARPLPRPTGQRAALAVVRSSQP
ncbi:hypothetical protein ACN28C_15815 [Plantactinospora sp. WMMC1484]|uniref:hypothetical protein n=1 Tax=Plantactinospora sp. WMMC1484 TaxID=3404122 RepID=UPI003BF5B5EF